MADIGYEGSKGSTKVEEKFKGTSWPAFSLEMKCVFFFLRVNELIYERKPRRADAAHPMFAEGVIHDKAVKTWVQQNMTAMAAIRQKTAVSFQLCS